MDYVINHPQQLAKVLRGKRELHKLSQTEVGERVGLLQKTVSTLENHPERSHLQVLFKILSALELELVLREKQSGKQLDW